MRRLLLFNPDTEMVVAANATTYTPKTKIKQMSEELSLLPCWWGNANDVVMSEASQLKQLPKQSQELLDKFGATTIYSADMTGLYAEPWGINPRECKLFNDNGIISQTWSNTTRELYSRKSAKTLIENISANTSAECSYHFPKELHPIIIKNTSELNKTLQYPILIKQPWSASGRGNLTLRAIPSPKEMEWISGAINKQGYIIVEPFLDKIFDFALEFKMEKNNCSFVGYSVFNAKSDGSYGGNIVASKATLEQFITKYLPIAELEQLKQSIIDCSEQQFGKEYSGYFGIDMLAYRNKHGKTAIDPCVEINFRMNMGILALTLAERYSMSGLLHVDYGVKPTDTDILLTPNKPNNKFFAYVTPIKEEDLLNSQT